MTAPNWKAAPEEFLFDRRSYTVPIYEQTAAEGDKLPGEARGSTKALAVRRAVLMASAPRFLVVARAIIEAARVIPLKQGEGSQFFREVPTNLLNELAKVIGEATK